MKELNMCEEYVPFSDLCELGQSTKSKFALVGIGEGDEDHTQLTPWVKCRDFLCDAMVCLGTGDPITIYGFSFTPNDLPVFKHYGIVMSYASTSSDCRYLRSDTNSVTLQKFNLVRVPVRKEIILDKHSKNPLLLCKIPKNNMDPVSVGLLTSLMRATAERKPVPARSCDIAVKLWEGDTISSTDNATTTIKLLKKFSQKYNVEPVTFLWKNMHKITKSEVLGTLTPLYFNYEDVTYHYSTSVKKWRVVPCTIHNNIGVNTFMNNFLKNAAGYGFHETWMGRLTDLLEKK